MIKRFDGDGSRRATLRGRRRGALAHRDQFNKVTVALSCLFLLHGGCRIDGVPATDEPGGALEPGDPASPGAPLEPDAGVPDDDGGDGDEGDDPGEPPEVPQPPDPPAPRLGAPYPIVLAHGMFGTERFANILDYWYGIPDALERSGEYAVYVTEVDPLNDSTTRGAELEAQIEDILASTGHEKVVIIGHSQGGLDARVVAHDRPDLVAAVITIATPHGGSPLGQAFIDLLENPLGKPLVAGLEALLGPVIYDNFTPETDLYRSLHVFTPEGVADFDARYPDSPEVDYFSIAGRSSLFPASTPDCAADDAPGFITRWDGERDPLVEFAVTQIFLGAGTVANDGVVPTASARHGEFLGCIPADHLDEVGQLFGDGPGCSLLYGCNDFDYLEFYVDLAAWVRARGY
jgi:triacylglycerol lipase